MKTGETFYHLDFRERLPANPVVKNSQVNNNNNNNNMRTRLEENASFFKSKKHIDFRLFLKSLVNYCDIFLLKGITNQLNYLLAKISWTNWRFVLIYHHRF